MAAYSSNIDDVAAWLDEAIGSIGWDMEAATGQGTLAEEAIATITDGIVARALSQYGPDGKWDDNEDDYKKKKEKLYGDVGPNFRTEQMLSRESITGTHAGTPEVVEWDYGTGNAPANGKTKRDRTTTDIQKAEYAHEGQSEKKVKREFFGMDEQDADNVLAATEEAIIRHFERKASL